MKGMISGSIAPTAMLGVSVASLWPLGLNRMGGDPDHTSTHWMFFLILSQMVPCTDMTMAPLFGNAMFISWV